MGKSKLAVKLAAICLAVDPGCAMQHEQHKEQMPKSRFSKVSALRVDISSGGSKFLFVARKACFCIWTLLDLKVRGVFDTVAQWLWQFRIRFINIVLLASIFQKSTYFVESTDCDLRKTRISNGQWTRIQWTRGGIINVFSEKFVPEQQCRPTLPASKKSQTCPRSRLRIPVWLTQVESCCHPSARTH